MKGTHLNKMIISMMLYNVVHSLVVSLDLYVVLVRVVGPHPCLRHVVPHLYMVVLVVLGHAEGALYVAIPVDNIVRYGATVHALYDGPCARDPLWAGHHEGHTQDQKTRPTVVNPDN